MPDKEFSGLWIPRDIIMDKGLTSTDKLILAAVEALSKEGACYASNKYIAEVTGGSFELVRKTIYKLQKNGYLTSADSKDMFAFTAKRALVRVQKRQDGCGNGLPLSGNILPHSGNIVTDEGGNILPHDGNRVPHSGNILPHDGNGLPPTSGNILPHDGNRLPHSGNIFPEGGNIVTECGNRVPPYNINNINNNIFNNTDNNIAATRAREAEPVDNFVDVVNMYENTIRPIPNKIEQDNLVDLYDEFGAEWMKEAIREAGKSGGRSISYLAAILRRWERSGLKEPWKKPYKKNVEETPTDRVNRILAELEEM